MPLDMDLQPLVGMQESESTLVRFEDETDKHAPRLNYSVPLPGTFEGRFYIGVGFRDLPWKAAAFRDLRVTPKVQEEDKNKIGWVKGQTAPLGRPFDAKAPVARKAEAGPATKKAPARVGREETPEPDDDSRPLPISPGTSFKGATLRQLEGVWTVQAENLSIPWSDIVDNAREGRALVIYRSFGGALKASYKQEAKSTAEARPRFVIIEHYRMSSLFGDYGAGRTVSVFSLLPGEETRLYIRNWKRTEEKKKEASSIFDSFTQEAADDFSEGMESETTDAESQEQSNDWHAKFSASCNLGFGGIGASASAETGFGGSSKSARESMAKSASKVTTQHASKASSKRDTTVSTEINTDEAQEFETIIERKVKNVNLSRTLNIVTRELNQEFTTYLALVDVTMAFVNDLGVFDEYQVHEIDIMLQKYLPLPPKGNPGKLGDKAQEIAPYSQVRKKLLDEMTTVFDYQGDAKTFLEVAQGPDKKPYYRVRHRTSPDQPNPFYPNGEMPVDGVVMNINRNTVKTDAVIIDALLGHGVALDNYALGTQQETLLQQQLANRKTELALKLIEEGDAQKLDAFRSLFGSVDGELLKQVVLGS
jgi:hypothetical protein